MKKDYSNERKCENPIVAPGTGFVFDFVISIVVIICFLLLFFAYM